MKSGGFTWPGRLIGMKEILGEKTRELIDESTIPDIEPAVLSDVSTLLERTSGLSLAEMDKAIQEL
jgi:hypothetical protein